MEQNPQISADELKSFYSADRHAYARLVISLGFPPSDSKKIVAFWNRLERVYCFRNFVKNLEKLSDADLYALAHEAIRCFQYIDLYREEEIPLILTDVPRMEKLANQVISLGLIFPQQESSVKSIADFANNVCENVFSDIVPRTICLVEENQAQDSDFVPEANRTLFITFSKGHPISKQELRNLLTRKYGDIVETIYMKNTDPQPLFARVVVNAAGDTTKILGNRELVKFSYNGKDVWVRKFVLKYRDSASGTSRY